MEIWIDARNVSRRQRALLKYTMGVKVDARLSQLTDLILSHTRVNRVRIVRERPWIALGVGLH